MKRAFVFLVAAPVTVFFAVLLMWVVASGTRALDFGALVAGVLSVFAMPMSMIGWITDEFLARAFPFSLRVCSTALVGAMVAAAEVLAVFSSLLPSSIMMALAIGGAAVMAACSLLSHDFGDRQQHRLEPAGA
jgi:hypothetical protein